MVKFIHFIFVRVSLHFCFCTYDGHFETLFLDSAFNLDPNIQVIRERLHVANMPANYTRCHAYRFTKVKFRTSSRVLVLNIVLLPTVQCT